ncbi:transcriptional regulator [Saccharothrix sp. ALI-22-I]|uniref:MmyB family transcriptional regulator n=1 Tax=Saccharothrix sp. ALI-22-I TaxID=1933778 RepID=UPI00097C9CE3|nr:helix-turn-helix domain-containing protein [Saccharothrix sp. ALI-22-I]ONI92559.1 transcriptional regulator [Saccharothrix sp. ALI-22-I]
MNSFGDLLRQWRQRRRLSQLDLAIDAEISARHLSFLETGRAQPSRAMTLLLADRLDVPLRERNHLLLAAGYAPVHPERSLDDPQMSPARAVLDAFLAGHEPNPALVVDRQWNLLLANQAAGLFLEGAAPELIEPPINVLRLTLHPDGLARRLANLDEVRDHLLHRLAREAAFTGDPELAALHEELSGYGPTRTSPDPVHEIALPIRIRDGEQVLNFLSTITTFGTALDVVLAELTIEAFYPADPRTADALLRR